MSAVIPRAGTAAPPSPNRAVPLLSSAAWLLIAAAAWFAPRELDLTALAIIAVTLVTWHTHWSAGLALASASAINAYVAALVLGAEPVAAGYRLVAALGTWVALGVPVALIGCLHAQRAREARHARIDPLTGVLNGAGFNAALEVEIARHGRTGAPFAFALFDCDGFKAFNARIGRRQGDAVLQLIAAALERGLRKTDVVARLGGDDFAVLLPQTGLDEARTAIDPLRDALQLAAAAHDTPVRFTVAVGVFHAAADAGIALDFMDELMARARSAAGAPPVYAVHTPARAAQPGGTLAA